MNFIFQKSVIAWDLYTTMKAEDVEMTINKAMEFAQISETPNASSPSTSRKSKTPRLLSDNGPCYISTQLALFLDEKDIKHIRGRPNHPQTQGKIERYHRTMKNVIKLHHYFYPEELEQAIQEFVDYYNYKRYHESLNNLTPADVYFGTDKDTLKRGAKLKTQTMKKRKKRYHDNCESNNLKYD